MCFYPWQVSGALVTGSPSDGCSSLDNHEAVAGNIALLTRGGCMFIVKVGYIVVCTVMYPISMGPYHGIVIKCIHICVVDIHFHCEYYCAVRIESLGILF